MIEGVAQFGILLLLLLTGMETDLKLVRRVGRAAIAISITGIVVPFICGFALGSFSPKTCCRIRKRGWWRRCFSAPRCRSRR